MVRSEPSLSDYPQATGRSSPFTFNSCRMRSGWAIRPVAATNRPTPCWGTACFGASVIKRAAMRRAVTKIAEKSPPSLCMMKFKCFDEKKSRAPVSEGVRLFEEPKERPGLRTTPELCRGEKEKKTAGSASSAEKILPESRLPSRLPGAVSVSGAAVSPSEKP